MPPETPSRSNNLAGWATLITALAGLITATSPLVLGLWGETDDGTTDEPVAQVESPNLAEGTEVATEPDARDERGLSIPTVSNVSWYARTNNGYDQYDDEIKAVSEFSVRFIANPADEVSEVRVHAGSDLLGIATSFTVDGGLVDTYPAWRDRRTSLESCGSTELCDRRAHDMALQTRSLAQDFPTTDSIILEVFFDGRDDPVRIDLPNPRELSSTEWQTRVVRTNAVAPVGAP